MPPPRTSSHSTHETCATAFPDTYAAPGRSRSTQGTEAPGIGTQATVSAPSSAVVCRAAVVEASLTAAFIDCRIARERTDGVCREVDCPVVRVARVAVIPASTTGHVNARTKRIAATEAGAAGRPITRTAAGSGIKVAALGAAGHTCARGGTPVRSGRVRTRRRRGWRRGWRRRGWDTRWWDERGGWRGVGVRPLLSLLFVLLGLRLGSTPPSQHAADQTSERSAP
jgi:hypothetical protein